MSDTIRVVLAEDHPVYRDGLRGLLTTEGGFEVVGVCGTGAEAVGLAETLHPDVVVMDLNLPDIDGVEATKLICALPDGPNVLMLSMFDDDEMVFRAMGAGARGYLVKTAAPQEIIEAVRSTGHGGAVFSGALSTRLGSWFDQITHAHDPFAHLSPREREVLGLLTRGQDNSAIAVQLAVSPKTVRNMVSNVLSKLQVPDRAAAVAKARASGFRGRR